MEKTYHKFKDELLNSCVPFWLKNGVDKEYGGLLNCLDRTGKVYSQDKSVWMQGSAGWMFSYMRLFCIITRFWCGRQELRL